MGEPTKQVDPGSGTQWGDWLRAATTQGRTLTCLKPVQMREGTLRSLVPGGGGSSRNGCYCGQGPGRGQYLEGPTREIETEGPEGRCREDRPSKRWPIWGRDQRGQTKRPDRGKALESLCQSSLRGSRGNPKQGGNQGSGFEGRWRERS